MKRMMQILISASALWLVVCAAGAQQAPPAKTEPAKPKAKRVWTNDDVTTLRQPADVYEEEKRKKAEEEAAKSKEKAAAGGAAADAAKQKPESPEEDFLPKTVEDAEKLVAAKQYEIGQQYEAIDLVKKELAEATTDASRAAFQKRIDQLTATLEESVAEMKAVDGRLLELKAKPPASPKPPAPKP